MVHADAGCLSWGGIRNESSLSEKNDCLPEWMVQNTKRPTKLVHSRIGAPILKPWLHDIELKMV